MKAIAGFALATLVLLPLLLPAAESKSGTGKRMHLPLKGTVVAVSPELLTLKGGEGKPDRRFKITSETTFLKGDDKAAVDDIRARQYVTGSFVRSPNGVDTLTKLQLAPKPSTPSPKKKAAAKTVSSGAKGTDKGKGGGGNRGTGGGGGPVKQGSAKVSGGISGEG